MDTTAIANVTDTAAWVATYRARETLRSDALFKDPLAKILAGPQGETIAAQAHSRGADWYVVIRTCIIDDFIRSAVADGVDTVINIGAGLDTRPYRLDLPADLLWIEVDYPGIIDPKTTLLSQELPCCRLERTALDLNLKKDRQDLFAAIDARSKKVLVLTEGVLPYLSEEQVFSLGQDLALNASFQLWIVDYFSKRFMKMMNGKRRKNQMKNAPFIFGPDHWLKFFAAAHWTLKEMKFIAPTARALGRNPPLPYLVLQILRLLPRFISRSFDESTGFALLQVQKAAICPTSDWPSSRLASS